MKENNDEILEKLKDSCIKGEIDTIQKYLFSESNTIDVNVIFTFPHKYMSRTERDGTLLQIACVHKHLEIVKLLCSHPNINLNKQNSEGNTPLYDACFLGEEKTVKFLSEIPEIDINLGNSVNLSTPLHIAAYHNRIDMVRHLLEQSRTDVNKQDVYGQSALHEACRENFAMTEIFSEYNNSDDDETNQNKKKKFDINLRDINGKTPFYWACEEGNLCILEEHLYLKFKNDLIYENHFTNQGYSPLSISCKNGHFEIVEFLLENNINKNIIEK